MKTRRMLVSVVVLLWMCSVAEPAKRPRPFQKLEGHTDAVWCVAFSPDGKTVASGSADGTVRLWDVTTGKQKCVLHERTRSVEAVIFSKDGKTLIASSCEPLNKDNLNHGHLTWWDVATRKQVRDLRFPGATGTLALSPNGKILAIDVGDEKRRSWLHLYDAATGKELVKWQTRLAPTFAISADSRRLVLGCGGVIQVWDLEKKKVLQTVNQVRHFGSLALSPDGKQVASSNSRGTRIYDLGGRQAMIKSQHDIDGCDGNHGLVFSRDGKCLVVGRGGGLFVLSAKTGKRVGVVAAGQEGITNLAISRDGKLLAVVGEMSRDITLWKFSEWEFKRVDENGKD